MILFLISLVFTGFVAFIFGCTCTMYKKVWIYVINIVVFAACISMNIYSGLRLQEKYEVIQVLPNNHVEAYRIDCKKEKQQKVYVELKDHQAHPGDIILYDGTLCICSEDYIGFD